MSDDTMNTERYHVFVPQEYDTPGGMGDYVGSYGSLDAILAAFPEQRDHETPLLHVAYESHSQLARINYITEIAQENGTRTITWFWEYPQGQRVEVQKATQYWHPIDQNALLQSLGLPPGAKVTGYIPAGAWRNDPL